MKALLRHRELSCVERIFAERISKLQRIKNESHKKKRHRIQHMFPSGQIQFVSISQATEREETHCFDHIFHCGHVHLVSANKIARERRHITLCTPSQVDRSSVTVSTSLLRNADNVKWSSSCRMDSTRKKTMSRLLRMGNHIK